jgi:hypothetical protein
MSSFNNYNEIEAIIHTCTRIHMMFVMYVFQFVRVTWLWGQYLMVSVVMCWVRLCMFLRKLQSIELFFFLVPSSQDLNSLRLALAALEDSGMKTDLFFSLLEISEKLFLQLIFFFFWLVGKSMSLSML